MRFRQFLNVQPPHSGIFTELKKSFVVVKFWHLKDDKVLQMGIV